MPAITKQNHQVNYLTYSLKSFLFWGDDFSVDYFNGRPAICCAALTRLFCISSHYMRDVRRGILVLSLSPLYLYQSVTIVWVTTPLYCSAVLVCSTFWLLYYLQYCHAYKDPLRLHTKLPKMQLSSIHTTTMFHNCNNFFDSFIHGQQFSQLFLIISLQFRVWFVRHLSRKFLYLTVVYDFVKGCSWLFMWDVLYTQDCEIV
mgnify:CR=1 FL=1